MIANLGMYDLPHLRAHTDALWINIRRELGYGPDALTRVDDMWPIWQSPGLLMSQTCGYPYRARLHDKVQLIGTPDYDIPGCPPGHYRSVVISHWKDDRELSDLDGAHFAYNEPLSQSGWAAPMHHMTGLGLSPGQFTRTGSHAASALAVAKGEADFAALDVLTYMLLAKHDPDFTANLRIVAQTEPTPTLPYITGPTQNAPALSAAVSMAISKLPQATRTALRLRGLVQIPKSDYLAVPTPKAPPN